MRWLSILFAASCFAQIPTTTKLSLTPNRVNVSAPAIATVTVTPAVTGTVTIYDRSTEIARRVLNNSAASIQLSFKTPGTPFLRAIYTGSATHSSSASTELKVSVRSPSVTAFLAPVPQAPITPTRDLNFDGIPDSYTVSQSTITIRFGTAGGGLGSPVTSNLPPGSIFFDFADFNGDGRMDVLSTDSTTYLLQVFAGGIGGEITPQVLDSIPIFGYPFLLSVRDANADGFPDLSYREHYGLAGLRDFVRLNDGKGKFLADSDLRGGHYLGDRNGDGLSDFARVKQTYIGRYLGPSTCELYFSPDYLYAGGCGRTDASIVGVADIGGDGLLDLVSASSDYSPFAYVGPPQLTLLSADPAGGYTSETIYPVPEGQYAIGLADMNGDGREDVVSLQSNAIVIRFGMPSGTLSAPVVLNAPGMTSGTSVSISDATGDGVPDIVLVDVNGQTLVFGGLAGPIAPSSPPTSVSVTSGAGLTGTFTAKYQDTNGAIDLSLVSLLISPTRNGANACLVEVNTVSNRARLMNDAGNGWTNYELITPSSPDLANAQCTVTVGSMSVASSGNELTITVPLKFSASFAGQKKIYLNAMDAGGLESTFIELGQWNVSTPSQPPPIGLPDGVSVKSLTPVTGTGNTTRFRAIFQHSAGKHYLGYVLFLPTPNVVWYTAQGSCLVEYNRISNGIRLVNDAGDGWLGPVSGVVIRTGAETLENAQCTVNVASAAAQVTGNTMTVEANVTFKAGVAGVLGTFLQAFDTEGSYTGMTQFGNWVAPGTNSRSGPAIQAAQLTRSGAVYNLTASVRHTAGLANLSLVHVRIGPRILGDPVCHIIYSPSVKKINLVDDTDLALVSSTWMDPGAGTLSNSYCTVFGPGAGLNDAQFSQLGLTLRFNPVTFSGPKYLYVNAFDDAGLLTHWVTANSVTIE
ncbi:MAG TPA: VCBS repeat-containing protein [Bryobacteraceae bacterium]|nr:VCBS repeat-containing protein [Bryobacteraceae bacterium]